MAELSRRLGLNPPLHENDSTFAVRPIRIETAFRHLLRIVFIDDPQIGGCDCDPKWAPCGQ